MLAKDAERRGADAERDIEASKKASCWIGILPAFPFFNETKRFAEPLGVAISLLLGS